MLCSKREGEEETLNIFMAPVGVREGGNKFPLEEMLLPSPCLVPADFEFLGKASSMLTFKRANCVAINL